MREGTTEVSIQQHERSPVLHNPQTALTVFNLLESLEWRFTPSQIVEQDEALMDDLLVIVRRKAQLKNMQDVGSITATTRMPKRDFRKFDA